MVQWSHQPQTLNSPCSNLSLEWFCGEPHVQALLFRTSNLDDKRIWRAHFGAVLVHLAVVLMTGVVITWEWKLYMDGVIKD